MDARDAGFDDDHLWVRFKEQDLIRDDVLLYQSSFEEHSEWNVVELNKSEPDFIIEVPISNFKDLALEFDEKQLIIYPQFALAQGEGFIMSKDTQLEAVNVTESMIPA